MKVKINKIFGQYDVVYDYNQRCCVYIGENGIGKSTILRILNCIKNLDFIEILKYDFSSLEFNFDDEYYIVKYEDLVMQYSHVMKKYELDIFEPFDQKISESVILEDADPYLVAFYMFLEKNKDYYIDFVKYLLNDNILNSKIKESLDLFDNPAFNRDAFFKDLKKKLLSNFIDFPIKLYEFTVFSKMEELQSRLLENVNCINFYINMAGEYDVENYLNNGIINQLEDSLKISYDKYFNVMNSLAKVTTSQGYNFLSKYGVTILKDMYKKDLFINEYETKLIAKTKKINLANILFNKAITEDIINDFKDLYYSFIEKNFYDKKDSFQELSFKYPLEDLFVVNNYLLPLIPAKGLFYEMSYENRYKFYLEFESKIYNKIINNLAVVNSLLEKYITNKKVIATPNGIVISLNSDVLGNDLSFDKLSAGEKKLIIIFILCTSFENIDFCLDEPENSLSVVWQKNIINDILVNSVNSNLIIATQSPYIISDDSYEEAIVYLPMENRNE